MPLALALIFHFNQHTGDYADVADKACYRGLLNVLRKHPRLKFNLHLSGTLLRALAWLDPETLQLVRAGLADGQFELLGSTYAQNLPYASDDWDNRQQINLHRDLLQHHFGVSPRVFWNAERTWRQSLVGVMAQGGFQSTLVEDHILHAAGLAEPVPVSTTHDGKAVTCIYDDTILRSRFNYAVWFGRKRQLFDYLRQLARRKGSSRFLLAYAEDAEAMGLWNWEQGYLPQAVWKNLDGLLTLFERSRLFKLVHLSPVQARRALGPLPDGAAEWMDRSLSRPGAPYHEDGFADWFDFYHRSPKVRFFRQLYHVIRRRLQALGSALEQPDLPVKPAKAAERFYRQAIETYLHHQYEYGCIGVGGRKYWGWENVRSAMLFANLAELSRSPQPRRWLGDFNGDGSDEQMLCDGRRLVLLSHYGGRLVGWFDLAEGRQLAGNQLAVPTAPYDMESTTGQPHQALVPAAWLPEAFDTNLRPWSPLKRQERLPTRMARWLPEWIFEREPRLLPVYRRPRPRRGARTPLRCQMGIFNDAFSIEGIADLATDLFLDYRVDDAGVTYLVFPTRSFTIEKYVWQTETGVAVRYTIANHERTARRVRLRSMHELAPDYLEAATLGRPALSFFMLEGLYPGVLNNATRTALVLDPSVEWKKLDQTISLLALEVALTFELEIPKRSQKTFEIKLGLHKL